MLLQQQLTSHINAWKPRGLKVAWIYLMMYVGNFGFEILTFILPQCFVQHFYISTSWMRATIFKVNHKAGKKRIITKYCCCTDTLKVKTGASLCSLLFLLLVLHNPSSCQFPLELQEVSWTHRASATDFASVPFLLTFKKVSDMSLPRMSVTNTFPFAPLHRQKVSPLLVYTPQTILVCLK